MDVRVVYVDGCPNWRTAHERLGRALELLGAGDTPVLLRGLTSGAAAESADLAGSPTILVDGHDLFPGTAASDGLACRIYRTPDGPAGAPTVAELVRALSERGST